MVDFAIAPDFAAFSRNYEAGQPVLLSTTLVADLETPVSAMLKIVGSTPYSFLLESVEGGATLGRYSFIGLEPDIIWQCRGGIASINRTALSDPAGPFLPATEKPFASLQQLLDESRIAMDVTLPPMAAGLFGYLGYDIVREIEKLPDTKPDELGVPDSILSRPTIIVVFDNIQHTLTIITPVRPNGDIAGVAYGAATQRVSKILARLQQPVPSTYLPASTSAAQTLPDSNTSQAAYEQMVVKAKDYITAGDIFQVVLSHRFALPFTKPALSFYRTLRRLNPSPFLFLLNFENFAVAGSSPEVLVRVRDKRVTIRPLAGTRRRGKDAAEDERLASELLADEKELAEHLMLLDLGRNDVGRVAKPGTVNVTEKMVIERYSHVMHISSTVEGELQPALTVLDALAAGFPAGTVSGAPKVRAMEIIDELEVTRRGIYGGCIGYFGANGDMDTCIALRTAVLKDGMIYVQAGAGIVADSDAAAEYEETCNKAGALIKAAGASHT